jgi:hypothetical protein
MVVRKGTDLDLGKIADHPTCWDYTAKLSSAGIVNII